VDERLIGSADVGSLKTHIDNFVTRTDKDQANKELSELLRAYVCFHLCGFAFSLFQQSWIMSDGWLKYTDKGVDWVAVGLCIYEMDYNPRLAEVGPFLSFF